MNHTLTLGNFTGDKVWIEDDEGTSIEKLSKNNKVEELKRTRIVHDKPMFFNDLMFLHGMNLVSCLEV